MLTACGKADIVTGYKSGDVKLGQYKGVTYTPEEVSVTDDEIMSEVQRSLIENHEQNVDVEGKTVVENGDTIICDYKGFMDGACAGIACDFFERVFAGKPPFED